VAAGARRPDKNGENDEKGDPDQPAPRRGAAGGGHGRVSSAGRPDEELFAIAELAVERDLVAVDVVDLFLVSLDLLPFGAGIPAQGVHDPGAREDLDRFSVDPDEHMSRLSGRNRI